MEPASHESVGDPISVFSMTG